MYHLFTETNFCCIIFYFVYREISLELDGKTFVLGKDMVTVKKYQKTVHGKTLAVLFNLGALWV